MIVVSPLKALMREQVEALNGRGSRAVCVGEAVYEELVHDEIQDQRRSLSIPFLQLPCSCI